MWVGEEGGLERRGGSGSEVEEECFHGVALDEGEAAEVGEELGVGLGLGSGDLEPRLHHLRVQVGEDRDEVPETELVPRVNQDHALGRVHEEKPGKRKNSSGS